MKYLGNEKYEFLSGKIILSKNEIDELLKEIEEYFKENSLDLNNQQKILNLED